MLTKLPDKTYALGGPLPPIPQKVVSWPWGGTPHLTQWSLSMLQYPLGTLIYDVVDGHPVLAQIQTHYSYGAHPDWPDKAHKGTSVFVPVGVDQTGKTVAMHEPPDGWGDAGTSMGYELDFPTVDAGWFDAHGEGGVLIVVEHPDFPIGQCFPNVSGEMYTKRKGGGYRFSGDRFGHDGARFTPEVCDPFCVRRHGMIY